MIMKNKLLDLNNHLFLQLERLNDEGLKGEALKDEIERSKAVSTVARDIVQVGRLVLDAEVAKQEHQLTRLPLLAESKDA
jgi:hypothetical protein